MNHADHEFRHMTDLKMNGVNCEWGWWQKKQEQCTQVCNFCTNVWNICTRVVKQKTVYQSVWKCTKVCENVPECLKMYKVCVLYQSVCFCTKVCVFVPKCDFVSKNYNFSVAYWFSQYPIQFPNNFKFVICIISKINPA